MVHRAFKFRSQPERLSNLGLKGCWKLFVSFGTAGTRSANSMIGSSSLFHLRHPISMRYWISTLKLWYAVKNKIVVLISSHIEWCSITMESHKTVYIRWSTKWVAWRISWFEKNINLCNCDTVFLYYWASSCRMSEQPSPSEDSECKFCKSYWWCWIGHPAWTCARIGEVPAVLSVL